MESNNLAKTDRKSLVLHCVVCSDTVSQKSLVSCTSCKNPICKLHTRLCSDQTLCDNCLKLLIKSEVLKEMQTRRARLSLELSQYESRHESQFLDISKKDEKIALLESSAAQSQESFSRRSEELIRKIEQQELINKSEYLIISSLTAQIDHVEKSLETSVLAVSSLQTEVLRSTNEQFKAEKVVRELEEKIEQLLGQCRLSIPYRRLRNTTCVKCHENIKIKLKEMIYNSLNQRNSASLIESLFDQPKEKQEACSCIIN